MRMRKKKNLGKRMEKCSSILVQKPELEKGKWKELMPEAEDVYVELGCGKGRFTAGEARHIGAVLLVALEKVPDAMIMAMERAQREEISNVRFITSDAALLPEYFETGEVGRIYINFCDPWPSKRHAKRRLTSDGFLELYKQVLRESGEIHFKTDNSALFEYSLERFEEAGFALKEVTRDLHKDGVTGVLTDYEAKFMDQGIPICRCVACMN